MNLENVLKVIAVFVAYLFLSIPVSQALTLNIIGGSTIDIDYSDYVTFNVQPQTGQLAVSFTAEENVEIRKVFVFRCKSMNPDECEATAFADDSEGDFQESYTWCELSDECTKTYPTWFPQVGSVMVIAKIADMYNREFWMSKWYKIERTDFNTYVVGSPESVVDVYPKGGYGYEVQNYISTYNTIPLREVQSIGIPSADSLFNISSTNPLSGSFSSEENHDSEVLTSTLNIDYSFIFGKGGDIVTNPVTLYMNPTYECGNEVCEESVGETTGNCCYDCPCGSAQYCDSVSGCRFREMITLVKDGTHNLMIPNCVQSQDIVVNLKVNNQPTGVSMQSFTYELDTDEKDITGSCKNVEINGNEYSCTITVPGESGCEGEGFGLYPNRIRMRLSYPNGPGNTYSDLEYSLGAITAGTFNCGDGVCNDGATDSEGNYLDGHGPDLEEDYTFCCFDCPCPEGEYCSTASGTAANCECKPIPMDSYLSIADHSATGFYTHNFASGDNIDMNIDIRNRPLFMEISGSSCGLEVLNCDGCTAQCSMSCSATSSDDENVFSANCDLNFRINSYNPETEYDLRPVIMVTARYYDRNELKTVQLTNTNPFTIQVGGHHCGDYQQVEDACDELLGEDTPGSEYFCCYDCGCDEGDYCDTQNRNAPTIDLDTCKALSGVTTEITHVGERDLIDSYPQDEHKLLINLTVDNPPSGLVITPYFEFNGGDISLSGSEIDCVTFTEDEYVYSCNVSIPAFDVADIRFLELYRDYVDNVHNPEQVILGPNKITYQMTFNDGPHTETITEYETIGDVRIKLIANTRDSVCNDGHMECETWDYDADECEKFRCMTEGIGETCDEHYRYLDLDEVGRAVDCTTDYCVIDCRACSCPETTDSYGNGLYYCDVGGNNIGGELRYECRRHDEIYFDVEEATLDCYINPGPDGEVDPCDNGKLVFKIENTPSDFEITSNGVWFDDIYEHDNFKLYSPVSCEDPTVIDEDNEYSPIYYDCDMVLDGYDTTDLCEVSGTDPHLKLATEIEDCVIEDLDTSSCVVTVDDLVDDSKCPDVELNVVTNIGGKSIFYRHSTSECVLRVRGIINDCEYDEGGCVIDEDVEHTPQGIYYECGLIGETAGALDEDKMFTGYTDETSITVDFRMKMDAHYGGMDRSGTMATIDDLNINFVRNDDTKSYYEARQSLDDQIAKAGKKRDLAVVIMIAGLVICAILCLIPFNKPVCINCLKLEACASAITIKVIIQQNKQLKHLKEQLQNLDDEWKEGTYADYNSFNMAYGDAKIGNTIANLVVTGICLLSLGSWIRDIKRVLTNLVEAIRAGTPGSIGLLECIASGSCV